MKPLNLKNTTAQGFSLVEMLVVISIIGVLAGIALPTISAVNATAQTVVNQRNAQHIVDMYQTGTTVNIIWSGTTRDAKITSIVNGAAPTSGAYAGKTFKVPGLAVVDQKKAYIYIGYNGNGDLYYDSTGSQSAN